VKPVAFVAIAVWTAFGVGGGAAAQPADPRSPGNTLTAESPAPDSSPVTPDTVLPPGARYGARDADRIRSDLRADGYSDVSDLRREGNHWMADARRDGKPVRLRIDAVSGRVDPVGS